MNRDWVCEISQTVGTGTYDLGGAPDGTSYFRFQDRYSAGNVDCFWVVNADRTKWEKNRYGTLTIGGTDTLSRGVVESTNGDAAVSWIGSDLPLRIYVAPDANPQVLFTSDTQTKVANFTLAPGESSIINNKSGSGCVMTSTPDRYRHLLVQNYTAQTLTSNAANVIQKGGATTTTAILPATIGAWAYLIGTGTFWRIMMSGT